MLSSWPERILQAFRDSPPGAVLPSPLIAQRADVDQRVITRRLDSMTEFGIVICESRQTKPARWMLGPAPDPDLAISRMRQAHRRERQERRPISAQTRSKRAQQASVVGKMRAMMQAGPTPPDGHAQALADVMEVARAVLAAKIRPGCRFNGAEVDLMVAAELRRIEDAARLAREALLAALWVMRS